MNTQEERFAVMNYGYSDPGPTGSISPLARSLIISKQVSGSYPNPKINSSYLGAPLEDLAKQLFEMMYIQPTKVIKKCQYCGQMGLISAPCNKCGGPIV